MLGILYAGSSFTASSISYSVKVSAWVRSDEPHFLLDAPNQAEGGAKTWYNLIRLGDYLSANTQYVTIDTANDVTATSTKDAASLEAFIRRIHAYNPAIKIIGISSPSWNAQDTSDNANAPTPTNLADITTAKTIFDHYGINYAAYLDEVVSLVQAETYDLIDLVADTVHPTSTGYGIMAELVEAYLPDGGAALPATLPARLYAATEDFEYAPTVKNGTDYDSRTGSWADAGTVTSSSSAGATITYSFTGRSFGIYRADGAYTNCEVSIDGGAYTTIEVQRNGYDIGTRAAHTVVIRVLSSIKIEEFFAI